MDAQLRAVQSRGPSFGVRVRSRAHQTPFCARGLQKNIAVSENAPGAHGIVPRHCSTRAAGMNTVSAARPPPRNIHSEAPAAEQSLRHSPRRNAKAANSAAAASAAKSLPQSILRRSRPCHETPASAAAASATKPPPRNPTAKPPPRDRLYLDAKSSRARPASSTARSTALSLM